MYVKWEDRHLCLDSFFGWQLFDMQVAAPENDGFYLPTSPDFCQLEVARGYPVLDGRSMRKPFDECRFFSE